jgi:hypothetical protein
MENAVTYYAAAVTGAVIVQALIIQSMRRHVQTLNKQYHAANVKIAQLTLRKPGQQTDQERFNQWDRP